MNTDENIASFAAGVSFFTAVTQSTEYSFAKNTNTTDI